MRSANNVSWILFFVGPPGVGKTTLVKALIDVLDPMPTRRVLLPKPKWTVANGRFCAAGHYKGDVFDGADTVGYNQAAFTLEWWVEHYMRTMPVTIFDGDRFSNSKVWERVAKEVDGPRTVAARVRTIHLSADDDVLAERRAARGSNQNVNWMKGRVTKAANFAALDSNALYLDASASTTVLLGQLRVALSI